MSSVARLIHVHLLLLLLLTSCTLQCGPGRRQGRLRRPRKMTPLVFKQHVPNVSENNLGASGAAEGKISRDDARFKDLVVNYNPDIIFKDEEGTGADRIMTQRCKDKLNTLAIAVMNRWPDVKLRVIEAWDEDYHAHAKDSLHYEGRAVDITTSDKDTSKYGMLARLAVEAGFDWVLYESRRHIHCSVKSDSSITIKTGGCFPGSGLVQLAGGQTAQISELKVGDQVLSMNDRGELEYSEVMLFLHRSPETQLEFTTVHTDQNISITLTSSHLIHKVDSPDIRPSEASPTFARKVRPGHYIYTITDNDVTVASRVTSVTSHKETGVYAPLTRAGTLIVDDTLVSCYALIDNHPIAHAVFAPMRMFTAFQRHFRWESPEVTSSESSRSSTEGIHWYAHRLYDLGMVVVPKEIWFEP